MAELKYKVGDRVRIKSFDWFRNEGAHNMVVAYMKKYYGEIVTIKSVHKGFYRIKEDGGQYCWIDEMFECKIEEETKPELKFKVGDKVLIKSLDWYNENKDAGSCVHCGDKVFDNYMSVFCGSIVTIGGVCPYGYDILEDMHCRIWTDEMFECKVEEETKPKYEDEVNGEYYSTPKYLVRPSGYQFKDENGNVINATKIVLEKKKKEYPKTYTECSDILSVYTDPDISGYKGELLWAFQKLLICRDAYWKLYGEEKGLGKPWEPDWNIRGYYAIARSYGNVVKTSNYNCDLTFVFPTEEMRDKFYENFKEEIESVKELL